jgi:hypothetical protein
MIRKAMLASLLLAVVSAGAATVKQLTITYKPIACGGLCRTIANCPGGCVCTKVGADQFGACVTP